MSELISQFDGAATTGVDPVSLTDTYTQLVGPLDMQPYDRMSVYLQNVGGAGGNNITDVVVEAAPAVAGPWVSVDASMLAVPLSSGTSVYKGYADISHKYMRVRARCAAGHSTTAKLWVCAGGYT